jgi:hypothetical protein
MVPCALNHHHSGMISLVYLVDVMAEGLLELAQKLL